MHTVELQFFFGIFEYFFWSGLHSANAEITADLPVRRRNCDVDVDGDEMEDEG